MAVDVKARGKAVAMPERPGSHLDYDDRCVIEEGIEAGLSASRIARRLGVSPSTVTREVKANRHGRPSKSKAVRPARKCANYAECRHSRDVCDSCAQAGRRKSCRMCKLAACADLCPDFAPRVCELLDRWPYLCRCGRAERSRCDLPKYRYDARKAQEYSEARLVHSRTGISISEGELAAMLDTVMPMIRNGLSPEAIWLGVGDELPVSVRTFYSWMEAGVVDVPAICLPRKVRCRPRKKRRAQAGRAALEGREYADFRDLPLAEQARAVEMDSVEGYAANTQRILSLHFVASSFQFYLLLEDATSRSVVDSLDMLERALGSPEAFEEALGLVLTDRGSEFEGYGAIERSCLDPARRRCRVYYCDALSPGQKGACERNHSELRRILPKGRSDFDALTRADLAVAASHVNSYPRDTLRGRCPVDVARALLPEGFVDMLGVVRVPLEEVVLRPSLLAHAVRR